MTMTTEQPASPPTVDTAPTELEQVIAAAVRAAWAAEPQLAGSDLGVAVRGTIATLSGSVVTEDDHQRAFVLATTAPGVSAVVDQLRVRI